MKPVQRAELGEFSKPGYVCKVKMYPEEVQVWEFVHHTDNYPPIQHLLPFQYPTKVRMLLKEQKVFLYYERKANELNSREDLVVYNGPYLFIVH